MRGYGHKPNPPDPRDFRMGDRLVGVAPLPDTVDFTNLVDHVRDQGQTNSCVGQALCRIAHVRAQIQGLSPEFPSALAAYTMGREAEMPSDPETALVDEGSIPRFVCQAMTKTGFVPESAWPLDPSKVNTVLPWDVMQRGIDHKLGGYYALPDDGPSRPQAIRQALAEGYPVAVALLVDQAFEEFTGAGTISALSGPVKGGHDVPILGYRPGAFYILNSWGSTWGYGGGAWVSDNVIAADRCMDATAVTVVHL